HGGRRDVMISYLIGLALRFLIPGGSASAGKVLFIDNSSHYASLFSFGAERAFMTWVTWTFAFAAGLFYFGSDVLIWILIGFILIALAPIWAYWLLNLSAKSRRWRESYRQSAPKLATLQLLSAFLMQLQYWLVLQQSGVISFGQSLTRMSLTNFSNSIPITFAGLGLRESFAIHFLADAGFTATQAVAATLTVFVFQDVLPGIVGAVTLLIAKKKPRLPRM
ncbi:MAG: lysylphosphatidylglycerol synthase domain-containing protein, partial [Candidatus Cloacimonadaceae bacterium]|nr:lysylphosphatidylglycerol synthase domain-containing protein [Candidatus Cloacimonadaceae bacterium]